MELMVTEVMVYGTDVEIPMALRLFGGEQALVFFLYANELSPT